MKNLLKVLLFGGLGIAIGYSMGSSNVEPVVSMVTFIGWAFLVVVVIGTIGASFMLYREEHFKTTGKEIASEFQRMKHEFIKELNDSWPDGREARSIQVINRTDGDGIEVAFVVDLRSGGDIHQERADVAKLEKDFVFKSHLQKMKKDELLAYLKECDPTFPWAEDKTRGEYIHMIVKKGFIKTRRK
jgi:hypothetical protein